MNPIPKEGAGRPLCESAPVFSPDKPATPPRNPQPGGPVPPATPAPPLPRPAWRPGPGDLAAVLLSFPLAYFYTRRILFSDSATCQWSMPVFAVLYLLGVGVYARTKGRPLSRETLFWAACWLAQSAAIALYGTRDALWLCQWLAWHTTAVYWTMSRTGMLTAGKSGIWTPLDLLMGGTVLPWRDIFLRLRTLFHSAAAAVGRLDRRHCKRLPGLVFSLLAALLLCAVAWGQLSGVDATFASLTHRLSRWLGQFFRVDSDLVIYFFLSLPVGAWLFGLAGGGLRHDAPPLPATLLHRLLAAAPRLPGSTGYLVPGALCVVYTLFFALQAAEFLPALAGGTLTAAAASDFAVTGFWELCRILLLDFAVLVALELFAGPLRRPGRRRLLLTLFAVYGLAFVLLASAKLGAYIWLYGPTPMRMLSGWFLLVLAVWCALALVWLWRPLPAARLGVLTLAASFALLCCLPVEQICIRENIRRYTAGQTEDIDVFLMRQCDNGGRLDRYIAGELLQAGWFEGQTAGSVGRLYTAAEDTWNGSCTVPLEGATLELTFQEGVCTRASLHPEN